jgi:hypothetical protein
MAILSNKIQHNHNLKGNLRILKFNIFLSVIIIESNLEHHKLNVKLNMLIVNISIILKGNQEILSLNVNLNILKVNIFLILKRQFIEC